MFINLREGLVYKCPTGLKSPMIYDLSKCTGLVYPLQRFEEMLSVNKKEIGRELNMF